MHWVSPDNLKADHAHSIQECVFILEAFLGLVETMLYVWWALTKNKFGTPGLLMALMKLYASLES